MRRVVVALGVFIVWASSLVQAQTKPVKVSKDPWFWVGAYVDYNRNMFNANFSNFPTDFRCDPEFPFTDGSGSGFAVGLLAEYPLSPMFTLEGRLGYTTLGGRLSRVVTIGNTGIVGGTQPLDKVESEHALEATLQAFSFEPDLNILLFGKVRATVGLRTAFLTGATYVQNETLLSPSYATFASDSTRVRNQFSGTIPNANTVQLAAVLGLGFDLPVGKNSTLTPEVRYNAGLSKLSDVDWSVSTLQFGLSYRYLLFKTPPPLMIKDTVIERDTVTQTNISFTENRVYLKDKESSSDEKSSFDDDQEIVHRTTSVKEHYIHEQPKLAELSAKVDVYPMNETNDTLPVGSFVIEETEVEENYPLLPQVFFPEGSADLGQTRMKLLQSSETASFSEFRLPHNTLDVYYNLLDIVASRMQMLSSAKLTVVGCNNGLNAEKNNRELAMKRAEIVRDYLVNVWHIESSRIQVKAQNLPASPANINSPEGQEENRRVDLLASDFELLRPVAIKDVSVKSSHSPLRIVPIVQSEAGIKNWKADIMQESTVLRTMKGESTPASYVWNVADLPYPKSEKPVTIKYSLTDNSGQTVDAEKQLTVKQLSIRQKRFEQKDDKRIDRFSLIVFDFNKSDLNSDNKAIAQDVKSRIHENSTVTIAGYADKTGEPDYNRDLARRRCVEVQKFVGLTDKNSVLQPLGSDTLLFDNSTPEGRAYCRTVQIIIETPVH